MWQLGRRRIRPYPEPDPIHSGWTESRALLGKSQVAVQQGLDEIQKGLPFRLLGMDSDNGSEFINWHLKRWCEQKQIQLTRGRLGESATESELVCTWPDLAV